MTSEVSSEDKLYGDEFRVLCEGYPVKLALIFGSRAKGEARPDSDWDLAFWVNEKDQKLDRLSLAGLKKNLIKDLCTLLKTSQIDLVILNRAPPFLKYQIARHSRPLYQEKEEDYAAFVSLAVRSYSDSFIFRDAGKKYLEMRSHNG